MRDPSATLGSGIACRSVGCGGTSVDFRFHQGRCVAVWTNEECPYDFGDVEIDDETQIASDEHNVCDFDVDGFVLAYLARLSRSEREAVLTKWSRK